MEEDFKFIVCLSHCIWCGNLPSKILQDSCLFGCLVVGMFGCLSVCLYSGKVWQPTIWCITSFLSVCLFLVVWLFVCLFVCIQLKCGNLRFGVLQVSCLFVCLVVWLFGCLVVCLFVCIQVKCGNLPSGVLQVSCMFGCLVVCMFVCLSVFR